MSPVELVLALWGPCDTHTPSGSSLSSKAQAGGQAGVWRCAERQDRQTGRLQRRPRSGAERGLEEVRRT